jgi:hypothetical protein
MYLRDKAVIESISEEKCGVIRRVKQQVEDLCCNLPSACCQITGFLEPYKAEIFPKARTTSYFCN